MTSKPHTDRLLRLSTLFAWLLIAARIGFSFEESGASTSTQGLWSSVYSWPDVGIHLHVLPDGRILTFADDDNPNYLVNGTRLAGSTKTFVVEIPSGGT